MTAGWVEPVLRSNTGVWIAGYWCPPRADEPYTKRVVVAEPEGLAGREVVAVEARPCAHRLPESVPGWELGMCGLVAFHLGDHWLCENELVKREGPWALVKEGWP